MAKHVNTFVKGIDADTNANSYSNQSYPYAENLRILSDNGLTSGTLSGVREALDKIEFPGGKKIVGVTSMRDNLIVFARGGAFAHETEIYSFPYSSLNSITSNNLSNFLKLKKNLTPSEGDVQVVARYESDTIQKVYWIEGKSKVLHANLALDYSELNGLATTKFELVQEVILEPPKLKGIVGGSLKTGVYQYAYCLFDMNGAETAYSSATIPIPISQSIFNESNSKMFKGSESGAPSGNGISIHTESAIDSRYDYVRVIRLYYAEQNSVPEVHIVFEGKVDGNLNLVDYGGTVLGSLILEDYRNIPHIFTAGTLETKNNYLFAGNITTETFDIDFDARAYRFRKNAGDGIQTTVCRVAPDNIREATTSEWFVSGSGNYKTIYASGLNINSWFIDEEYSINPFNYPDVMSTSDLQFKYQSDGTTLGGEGKYIKYRFLRKSRPADDSSTLNSYTTNYQDLSNPMVIQTNLGYQRGEVYRFGVVLYDKYGRQSFVKWVGDIKILEEGAGEHYGMVDSSGNIGDILLRFQLTNDGKNYLDSKGVVGWQVVRAERTYQDATVKDCGYAAELVSSNKSNQYIFDPDISSVGGSAGPLSNVIEYISPETVYNKNNAVNYNYIKSVPLVAGSGYTEPKFTQSASPYASPMVSKLPRPNVNTISGRMNTTGVMRLEASKKISSIGLGPIGSSASVFPVIMYNQHYSPKLTLGRATHGTALLIKIAGELTGKRGYVRRISTTLPYGGYSIDAIRNTVYYPCSGILPVNTDTHDVASGDCYIGVFEYMRGLCSTDDTVLNYNLSSNNTGERSRRLSCEICYMVVETKINLKFTSNPKWSQLDSGVQMGISNTRTGFLGDNLYNAMWETKGVHESGTPAGSDQPAQFYEQDYDLYTYNPAYSTMDKSKVFFMRPMGMEDISSIDTRVHKSPRKFNSEISDSWTKFPVNDFIDLDTKYGKLVKLQTFMDRLLYFQTSGVGALSVEDKEVVTGESGASIVLGTGGVIDRYDYITTRNGIHGIHHVATSEQALYFMDVVERKLFRFSKGLEPISDLKGIKSIIPPSLSNTVLIYHPKYNELYARLGDKTFLFNAYTNTFVSLVSPTFTMGHNFMGSTYIVTGNLLRELDAGNTVYPWELTLLINPNGVITNRYDSITFGAVITNSPAETPIETLKLYHALQQSPVITLSSSNIRNRFRRWIFNSMRDASSRRLYNPWLKVDITGTEDFLMHDVVTEYTAINSK